MDYIEKVLPDMKSAAARVARKWSQVTSEEDLFQDLVVHFLEAPGSLEKLAELPANKRLARLVAIGHERASKSRDDLEVFSGQFNYSVDEVRKLAERGAALDLVDGYNGASVDFQASLGELKKKNRDYWSVVVERYVNGTKFDRESNEAKYVLPRAMESLTTLMNRARATQQYQFTNGGRYRNNHLAADQIDNDYEGAGRYDD
jgi:hypothetical protein